MDFKKILNTLDSMEAPVATPAAPTLPKSAQLNEDAQLRVLAGRSTVLAESELMEKAASKAQQKAAGAALAAKRGEGTAKGASKEMAKMDTKDLKKFAGTKHKGLPEKKKTDESIEEFNDTFSQMVEAAKKGSKPDFLDIDKDGDKKEPMKKAVADKKKGAAPKKGVNPFAKKESVEESKLQPTPELMKKVRARLEQLHDEMEPEEAYEQMADELNITTRRLEQLLQDKRFLEADMGEAWSHNDAMQTNHNNKVSVMAAKEQADKATDPKVKEFWTRRYQMLAKRYNISVKEGRMRKSVKEADDRAAAKKTEREVDLPSGAKVKATKVQGWQSQKGDKSADKEKNESKMIPKGKKQPMKESVDRKLSFKEMIHLVQESGGQQQIDPTDAALFTWAQRIAKTKLGETMKAEIYAGLVYERMGGAFEMYDVLSETKK